MKNYIILFSLFVFSFSILQAQTFSGSAGALTDNNCTGAFNTFTATVSNVGVTDVIQSVTINISHTWVSDLNIFLVGPTGIIIELSTVNGGSGDNYVNTVFSDSAPSYITTGAAPFTGSFKPEGRTNNDNACDPAGTVGTYTFASQFGGINPNGNWTLKIKDGSPSDIGTLNSWSVTIGSSSASQRVGINTITPQSTLDVNGKVKIGNDQAVQAAGMIRYSTAVNDFEGFNGSVWKSMTGGTGTVNGFVHPTTGSTFESGLNNPAMTGQNNTAIGLGAGDSVTSGADNTAIGKDALTNNSSGIENTSIGSNSLSLNTTGFSNTASGFSSLKNNTFGNNNSGLGKDALLNNTSGNNNTGVGSSAIKSNTTGNDNTVIGRSALENNTTGNGNTAIGNAALLNNTSASGNTAAGQAALQDNTTGANNAAYGSNALKSNTTGANNTSSGYFSMLTNTTGSDNTANGYFALNNNTSGSSNTALGKDAGRYISNGSANQTSNSSIYIGVDSRASQNGNTNEIVIGNGTLGAGSNSVTIGNNQTLSTNLKGAVSYFPMGINAGETGQIKLHELSANGTNNIMLRAPDDITANINLTLPSTTGTIGQVLSTNGSGILGWVTPSGGGSGNGLVHPTAGSTFESGTNNPAMSGTNNTAIGVGAGDSFTTGTDNVAIGKGALTNISTGKNNVAIGSGALFSNVVDDASVAIGKNALYYDARGFNVAVGYEALYHNGQGSLFSDEGVANTAVGNGALRTNTVASFNTAVGNFALEQNINGYENTAIGSNALWFNLTGDQNTALGYQALQSYKNGNYNTAVGHNSLTTSGLPDDFGDIYNTAIGWESGYDIENHDKNTFLGADANSTLLDGLTNSTAIGYSSRTTANNQIRVGNSSITSIGGYAGWTNISDGRFKSNIKEDVHGLDFILKLRPVTYQLAVERISALLEEDKLKNESKEESIKSALENDKQIRLQKEQIVYTGFIAQEVDQLVNEIGFDFSGIDKPQNDKSLWGLRYGEFVVPLVKAVQEQQEMIDSLIKENEILIEYKAGFQTENTVLREEINQLAIELKALREIILNK